MGGQRVRFESADRALLAALLDALPRGTLRRLQLVMSLDTVLRWHRDLLNRRHAARSRPKRPGRPRAVASIRRLVLRLARENGTWGYRRVHGELALLGVTIAASIVWEILKGAGVDPSPDRAAPGWAAFLRGQAEAIVACDFLETVTPFMERWIGTCRRELLDRMLIWNQAHPLHALREYEIHYNLHRPHRSLGQGAPLHAMPEPISGSADIVDLNVRRRDRLCGILHEYEHAA